MNQVIHNHPDFLFGFDIALKIALIGKPDPTQAWRLRGVYS
jgi:hypothetical protein